jgi:diguanylate cyclase (GGDEF)-like protein
VADQAGKRRRAHRASFAAQFALVLLGVGLATALVAGTVTWFKTQQARSQQQLQSGAGAASLAATLVRMETASASQQFACEVARLPSTAAALAAGSPSQAAAEARADTSTAAVGQVLVLLGTRGQLLAQAPSTTVPGLSGLLSHFGTSPASCARAGGFFASSGSGEILGVGVATVSSGGLVRGRVAVLTPVGAAVLGFAQRLFDTSGSSVYPLLVASGRLVEPALVAKTRYPSGAALPHRLQPALSQPRRVVQVSLAGGQFVAAAATLPSAGGSPVASLVVVDSVSRIGPTVGDLAMPLALAVAGVLLLGMVIVFLLVERFLNRPLRRLDGAVRRMPEGGYATPIAIEGADEIARLAANFEIMRKRLLRQKIAAGSQVVIASTLGGNLPLEQTLKDVLLSLTNLLSADQALLLLLAQPQMPRSLLIASGVPDPLPTWAELEGSEGILGTLARDPRFLLRSHLSPEERGPVEARNGLRDCLAEPLRGVDRALGVLIVGNRRQPFLPDDGIVCSAVAEQIVMAVEKSTRLEATQREATTDAMTGLYNYRFLVGYLDQQVNVAERASAPLSVLMLDLDHFKVVNDSHGHPAGDQLLRRFASLMVDTIRKSDLAVRYGGEEFVVVMANTGGEDAGLVAEKIRRAVQEMTVELDDGSELRLTVSIGGVTFPEGSRGGRNLLDLADRALYAAKRHGRNCVEFVDLSATAADPIGG